MNIQPQYRIRDGQLLFEDGTTLTIINGPLGPTPTNADDNNEGDHDNE